MYYYMFELNGEKYYYYISIPKLDENEILDWAANKGLIDEKDIPNCTNPCAVSREEIKEMERELYKVWWEERKQKVEKGEEVGNIPPYIGIHLD